MSKEEENLIDANIYVVNRIGWEYNDEYYYRVDSSGGMPINAFTMKKLAEEYAKEESCKWFIKALKTKYDNPSDYLDWDGFDDGEIEELVKEVQHLDYSGREFYSQNPHLIKFDELYPMICKLGLEQFEVIAVKLTA